VEESVLVVVREHPEGLTAEQFIGKPGLESLSLEQVIGALNPMIAKDLVEVFKTKNKGVVFLPVDPVITNLCVFLLPKSDWCRRNGLSADEKFVFKVIEQAAQQGISAKGLRSASGMAAKVLNPILEALAAKSRVKVEHDHKVSSSFGWV